VRYCPLGRNARSVGTVDGIADLYIPAAVGAPMLRKLGAFGLVGLVVVLAGLALVAWESRIIAAGLALMLLGFGLTVKALVSNLLGSLGMGGMI